MGYNNNPAYAGQPDEKSTNEKCFVVIDEDITKFIPDQNYARQFFLESLPKIYASKIWLRWPESSGTINNKLVDLINYGNNILHRKLGLFDNETFSLSNYGAMTSSLSNYGAMTSPYPSHKCGTYINGTDFFKFYDAISVSKTKDPKPTGIGYIQIPEFFTVRYSAEYKMSSKELQESLNSVFSFWHGEKFHNPEKQKVVTQKLKDSLVAIHVDIYNKQTKEYERETSLPPPNENAPENNTNVYQNRCHIL